MLIVIQRTKQGTLIKFRVRLQIATGCLSRPKAPLDPYGFASLLFNRFALVSSYPIQVYTLFRPFVNPVSTLFLLFFLSESAILKLFGALYACFFKYRLRLSERSFCMDTDLFFVLWLLSFFL